MRRKNSYFIKGGNYKRLDYKAKRKLKTRNCTICKKETLSVYDKNVEIYCEECYDKKVN